MIELITLRHGPTCWNPQHRLQGRKDLPLSRFGQTVVRSWALPCQWYSYRWCTSPLRRACETAEILAGTDVVIEPRLVEMHWGQWEGRTLDELRAERGLAMQIDEAKGLDLRPPDGESPRDVCARLRPWLNALSHAEEDRWLAITHKGVIRALLALATGWDMCSKPPVKLRWDRAHGFYLQQDGKLSLGAINLALTPSRAIATN